MKSLAIITARGGSKRIPRKNIKEFMGKPMLFYAIEAAISSGLFSEVMVSTDDAEIADLAKKREITVHKALTLLSVLLSNFSPINN